MCDIIGFIVQQRYVLAATLFVGIAIGYAERSIFPMAITRMVEIPNQNATTSSKSEPICEAPTRLRNTTSGTEVEKAVIVCFQISNVDLYVKVVNSSNTESSIIGHKYNRG